MSRIVTKAELARLLDLSRSTISSYLKRGMPEEPDGRLDEAKCLAWIRQNVRVQSGMRGQGGRLAAGEAEVASDTGITLTEAKRIRATFDALLAEHRAAKLADSLAPVDAAIAGIADEHVIARDRLRAVPGWLAPKLVNVNDAPMVATLITKTFRGALYDLSKKDGEPAWDGDLTPAPLPDVSTQIYYVSCDGEVHYTRKAKEVEPPVVEPKKPRRRRRSMPAVEAAITEAGAEEEVDSDFVAAVERAIPTMTITEAKTRREIAEGELRRCEYDLLKRKVLRLDAVLAALTANNGAVRNNVLGIPSKIAPRVALLSDVTEIERVIAKEVELILDDLADPKALVSGCMND